MINTSGRWTCTRSASPRRRIPSPVPIVSLLAAYEARTRQYPHSQWLDKAISAQPLSTRASGNAANAWSFMGRCTYINDHDAHNWGECRRCGRRVHQRCSDCHRGVWDCPQLSEVSFGLLPALPHPGQPEVAYVGNGQDNDIEDRFTPESPESPQVPVETSDRVADVVFR